MAEIVFIGDDFTGASDTLATLAERGARVRLFLDTPEAGETDGLDAVGIATDLRARSPDQIDARLRALAPAVMRLDPCFVHYKVCSTFDSAPDIGSIGAAVLALESAVRPGRTVLLGGQPSLGRYCLFANLFAREPKGLPHRIDRHPIMRSHPVTPMDEADLRIHLARQGLCDLALVDRTDLHSLPDPLGSDARRVLVDAVEQRDVDRLGEVLRGLARGGLTLMVGASGVAEALVPPGRATICPVEDAGPQAVPILAIAGSRSSATAAQVAAANSYERLPVDPGDLAHNLQLAKRSVRLLSDGRNVLVYLQPGADYGCEPAILSQFLAELTNTILGQCSPGGVAVAGGDTSGAVVERLGLRSLSFVKRMGSGVAVCRGHTSDGTMRRMTLLLKGGQVGDVDLLDQYAREAGSSLKECIS